MEIIILNFGLVFQLHNSPKRGKLNLKNDVSKLHCRLFSFYLYNSLTGILGEINTFCLGSWVVKRKPNIESKSLPIVVRHFQ